MTYEAFWANHPQGRQRDGKEMLATMEERLAEVTQSSCLCLCLWLFIKRGGHNQAVDHTNIPLWHNHAVDNTNLAISRLSGDEKERTTRIWGERGATAGREEYDYQVTVQKYILKVKVRWKVKGTNKKVKVKVKVTMNKVKEAQQRAARNMTTR